MRKVGRQRSKAAAKLPPYVYKRRNEYVWRGYRNGQRLPQVVICRDPDAPLSEIWAAWERVSGAREERTMRWLWREYTGTARYQRLQPQTRAGYEKNADTMLGTTTRDGQAFGDVPINAITARSIRSYYDRRAATAPVAANRELALLRILLGYAREYDYLPENPAAGIRRNAEQARDRLVTPEEFWQVHDQAPTHIRIAMRLAVGLRARMIEVLRLRWSDVDRQRGVIRMARTKGSKTQDITITPLIEGALELAKSGATMGMELVAMKNGGRYTTSGFATSWQRHWQSMGRKGTAPTERFTFHDLKAAGVSWAEDPTQASGHKSPRMVAVYDRRIRTVDGTDFTQK